MQKIDISTIRESASSLITLNDGYLLYQSHEAQNINLLRDSTLNFDFVIEGEFKDVGKVVLYVGQDNTHGNCTCMEHGLCKHEICLYFELRDRVNEMLENKDLIKDYESNLKVDRLLNSVYNSAIRPAYTQIEVLPTVVMGDSWKLFLDAIIDSKKLKVKDIKRFLYCIENNLDYTFNYKTVRMSNKGLSLKSNQLINLIKYLETTGNTINLDLNIFDDIYNLYPNSIYVYNGYYSKEYMFSTDSFILNMNVNNMELRISDTSYEMIPSIVHDYIFYKEKIYVISNHTLYIVLDYLKKNDGVVKFNKDSYNSFLINIYPYIKDFVYGVDYCYDLSIDSYIDYKNHVLNVKYKSSIEDTSMFIKRTNYINYLNTFGFNQENNYTIDKYDDICEFVEYHLNELAEYGSLYLSDAVSEIKPVSQKHLAFNLKVNGGIVEFIYDDSEYSLDDINRMILSYKNGRKYIDINGVAVELNYEELKDITAMLDDLDIDTITENKIKLYQAYYLNAKYKKYIVASSDITKFYNDMVNYNDYNIEIEPSIKNTLRDYQISGVKWLKVLSSYGFGGILADDMGLGKTLQIISLIDSIKRNKPIMIVSPTSLIFNWAMVFKKFAPHIKYMVMYDNNRSDECVREAIDENMVIIISYESLRIDIEKYKEEQFLMCIIDEAQFIKNPEALKTIAVKSIRSDIKIALTGTPIENSLTDLWSIFDFVLPGYLGKKNKFTSKYDGYAQSSDVLSSLNKRIQPFILRRLKTDVLDLEEKIETISYSVMSKEEKDLYYSYLEEARNDLKKDNYKIAKVLSVLTRLRELACEPRMFLDNVGEMKNSKMDLLMELIEEKISDNHKILVFSQFTSLFPFIEQRLEGMGISFLKLTGQTKSLDRAMLVERFNKDDGIKVFLISLKAGGTGLNLTSADTVIHYDPWWNNAVMNQATDRAYRIGQERVVHEIKIVNKDTIEERILELQNKKKDLFNSVISEDDVIKKISLDDLKELFE